MGTSIGFEAVVPLVGGGVERGKRGSGCFMCLQLMTSSESEWSARHSLRCMFAATAWSLSDGIYKHCVCAKDSANCSTSIRVRSRRRNQRFSSLSFPFLGLVQTTSSFYFLISILGFSHYEAIDTETRFFLSSLIRPSICVSLQLLRHCNTTPAKPCYWNGSSPVSIIA